MIGDSARRIGELESEQIKSDGEMSDLMDDSAYRTRLAKSHCQHQSKYTTKTTNKTSHCLTHERSIAQ